MSNTEWRPKVGERVTVQLTGVVTSSYEGGDFRVGDDEDFAWVKPKHIVPFAAAPKPPTLAEAAENLLAALGSTLVSREVGTAYSALKDALAREENGA